ncbi:MAG TPA: hypothetical protein VGF37_08755 [Chthoniobacterales bacterium]
MFPLIFGIALDLFLLGRLILSHVPLSAAVAIAMMLIFLSLWYVFPWAAAALHV